MLNHSLKNDLILQALYLQETPYTPVWIMRQAGRYLPEYRKLRSQAGSFMNLCRNPQLACEVTMQPIRRFDLDAAILFSDILTIPDALGLGLHFTEGEGPTFERPICSDAQVSSLPKLDMNELSYVPDAIKLIQQNLQGKIPLFGFSGSPWTLAVYMVEGGSSKDFRKIKKMLYSAPETLHALLTKLTDAVAIYLNAQIEAGIDIVQIFDTWGGVLSRNDFLEFDCQYMERVVSQLNCKSSRGNDLPSIVFSKGCGTYISDLKKIGSQGLGLDWTYDLSDARRITGGQIALQGNIDPSILYASDNKIKNEVKRVLDSYGQGAGHIFNLGHGIAQDVEPEKLNHLINCVHELSNKNHRV